MRPVKSHRPSRAQLISIVILVAALYVFLPQFSQFSGSLKAIVNIDPVLLIAASLCLGLTFFVAALTYHLLSRHHLKYRRTVLVALANMFTNRLLPAGAGSIATVYLYLRRNRHTTGQSAAVIAVNNLLGFAAHMTLLLLLFLTRPDAFMEFKTPSLPGYAAAAAFLVLAVIIVIVVTNHSWRERVSAGFRQLMNTVAQYRKRPLRLVGAFGTSSVLTVLNVLTLWFCVLAVGVDITVLTALAVFSFGMLVGTATPTPGGLGGTEAGLLAALVSYQVPASQALAAVIVYRLLSYWLALLLGAVTYLYISRRHYLFS